MYNTHVFKKERKSARKKCNVVLSMQYEYRPGGTSRINKVWFVCSTTSLVSWPFPRDLRCCPRARRPSSAAPTDTITAVTSSGVTTSRHSQYNQRFYQTFILGSIASCNGDSLHLLAIFWVQHI